MIRWWFRSALAVSLTFGITSLANLARGEPRLPGRPEFDPGIARTLPPPRAEWFGQPPPPAYEEFYGLNDQGPQDETASRWLVGGGVTLPLITPVSAYDIGGGATIGLEIPRSDAYGFVVRLDYDHMNEGRFFGSGDDGRADLAALRAGIRITRHARGEVRDYTEAGAGLGLAVLRASEYAYDGLTTVERLETTTRVGPLFSFGGGLELLPASGGPGFFIESQVMFLLAGSGTVEYVPLRLGFLFPREL